MTKWLTDEEQKAWRAFIAMQALLEDGIDRELQRDAGMPHTYYFVLAMLSEAPGRQMRATDLAKILKSSQSRISHAVKKIEAKGWVVRIESAEDRRVVYIKLTKTGWGVLKKTAPLHVATVRRAIFDNLSPTEVKQFAKISNKIIAAVDTEKDCRASGE